MCGDHILKAKSPENHRMGEIGRDLWMSSGPTPVLKQGHLELAAQDCIQTAFE